MDDLASGPFPVPLNDSPRERNDEPKTTSRRDAQRRFLQLLMGITAFNSLASPAYPSDHKQAIPRTYPVSSANTTTGRGQFTPRATNQPHGPFLRKKGTWREAKFPLIIQMVPKGGLEPPRVSPPP